MTPPRAAPTKVVLSWEPGAGEELVALGLPFRYARRSAGSSLEAGGILNPSELET